MIKNKIALVVSTHSHPKVAAFDGIVEREQGAVSTHSHPKVAASVIFAPLNSLNVSTHSHPKVAALSPLKK